MEDGDIPDDVVPVMGNKELVDPDSLASEADTDKLDVPVYSDILAGQNWQNSNCRAFRH